jgi:hypothetical protein
MFWDAYGSNERSDKTTTCFGFATDKPCIAKNMASLHLKWKPCPIFFWKRSSQHTNPFFCRKIIAMYAPILV